MPPFLLPRFQLEHYSYATAQDILRLIHERRWRRVSLTPTLLPQVLAAGSELHVRVVEGLPHDARLIGVVFTDDVVRVYFVAASLEPLALVNPVSAEHYLSFETLPSPAVADA